MRLVVRHVPYHLVHESEESYCCIYSVTTLILQPWLNGCSEIVILTADWFTCDTPPDRICRNRSVDSSGVFGSVYPLAATDPPSTFIRESTCLVVVLVR